MSIITLTTDFGADSPYVAEMKGVILSAQPTATIVDITHSIPPQDVRQGARVLAQTTLHFPPGTIHMAVIDPGVGTERRLLYAEIAGQRYLAPDNGLLSLVARSGPVTNARELHEPSLWRRQVSSTFHGRDILSPVAAALAEGLRPSQLGPPVEKLVELHWPEPVVAGGEIRGEVVLIDTFGNAITNIPAALLPEKSRQSAKVLCRGRTIEGIVATYGRRDPGTLVALIGSSGWLEIALVRGNASAAAGIGMGDEVVVSSE